MVKSKSILITGGTGSFGKTFVRTLLGQEDQFERIIIFSRDEYKQFQMSQMPEFEGQKNLRYFIGDIRDKDRLKRALDGVDVVIHAAALKQVPSCEYNPIEAVKTNVLGAQNLIEAAIDANVKKVLALSSDKACSPINLYGATKLCSDKLFVAGNVYSGSHNTRFSVLRYGNVMGSRGSVIPYFLKLIEQGAKRLPITHFEMTRFWLHLGQAVEMALTALKKMEGGELFVRKNPSLKIVDLAKAIDPTLELYEIGLRPGEKIHEMMISREDARNTVEFDDYYVIQPFFKDAASHHGAFVDPDFEYHSGNNSQWLTIEEMRQMIYPEKEVAYV